MMYGVSWRVARTAKQPRRRSLVVKSVPVWGARQRQRRRQTPIAAPVDCTPMPLRRHAERRKAGGLASTATPATPAPRCS